MKAVIMCGGMGSRLKPLTENTPKPLIRLLNKPVIETIIEKVIESGITDIYLSLGYMAGEIADYCESKDFGAELHFCVEDKPLGTAGGVKNCIRECDEDILVLSGDNVFDIDLKLLFAYHNDSNSDFTVCAVESEDPREYGVISCDDDSSIKGFTEKPTWEQAEGNLVNTGIYVFRGELLSLIPENEKYDFSNDLFPVIFGRNYRFMCYRADGFWGDMGEFGSYKKIVRKILDKGCDKFSFEGTFFGKDVQMENGSVIKAPCILGKNTVTEKFCTVGPYSVIGADTVIGERSVVEDATIGDKCRIGVNCDINGCFIDNCVKIKDNCLLEPDCVVGFNSTIGRFSRILSGNKIWPGRRIESETVVSKDMLYENPSHIEFDIFGLSGKANSQISLCDITLLGQAIASASGISRVGIGSDESFLSENFRASLICGLRACGAVCYDFGEMFRSQAYFYSAYCNLDFFVYVASSGDVISLSFFGKNGMPVTSALSRNINNNYKFFAYNFVEPSQYNEVFNMKLFNVVYKSFFRKMCPLPLKNLDVSVETENTAIKFLADELFSRPEGVKADSKRKIQVLLNNTAGELFIVENGVVYSGERIISLLCELQCAEGNMVVIPEEAPSIIEENAKKYNGSVLRVYENSSTENKISDKQILNSIWTFDMFFAVAKLLNVMSQADISLCSLFECHKNFALRKSVIDIDGDLADIRKLIARSGAVKARGDIYYVFDGRMGKVRLRQMGNSRKIRIRAEADDMEAAKEISVFITKKIKSANIDKDL